MPIYEYQCSGCNRTFEAIQKFSDSPLTECTLCGKGPVAKVMSKTTFQLKGTGWYETDYKKKPSGDGGSGAGSS